MPHLTVLWGSHAGTSMLCCCINYTLQLQVAAADWITRTHFKLYKLFEYTEALLDEGSTVQWVAQWVAQGITGLHLPAACMQHRLAR